VALLNRTVAESGRKAFKIHVGVGKLESTSEVFAKAQHHSVAAGRHVSCRKRKKHPVGVALRDLH